MKSIETKGTNLSHPPLPPNLFPKEPVIGTIRTMRVGDKEFVHADDLYHSDENEKLYGRPGTDEWVTTYYDLIEKFNIRFNKTGDQFSVQLQPAVIYNDGLIDTGNTRAAVTRTCARQWGVVPWLWVIRISDPRPDTSYEQQKQLAESNITRIEKPCQQLRRFNAMRTAWCDQVHTPADAPMRVSPLEKLGTVEIHTMQGVFKECKLSLTWDSVKKLDTIFRAEDTLKKNFPNLYNNGKWRNEIGVNKGIDLFHSHVTGLPLNGKLVEDTYPLRDWTTILTPERLRRAATLTKDWNTTVSTTTITVNGTQTTTNFAPFSQFESSAIMANSSHAYNVILAEVLRNDGYVVTTPATKAGFDFDISFEFAGPDGIEYDKAEIKFTTYDGVNTQWKGGHCKREGEFILVAVEKNWQSIFIATTRLNRHDWQNAGRDGTRCKVAKLLDAHREELQYAAGNLIQKQSGAVEVQTVRFPL